MVEGPGAGRSGPRSKTGCSTCRTRKIKCDEERPRCGKCTQARLSCEWKPSVPRRRKPGVFNSGGHRTPPTLLPTKSQAEDVDENVEDNQIHVEQHLVALRRAIESHSLVSEPTLSTIEMSNSLVLDHQGLMAFQYVPESVMVMRFGKPWRWSMLSYVHSRVASQERGVMSAFVAVSSMELRFRSLIQEHGTIISRKSLSVATSLRYSASHYLQTALQDLSVLLDRVSRSDPDAKDLEAIFSIWFLIIHCGIYDSEMVKTAQVHLNGIRSFISQYLQQAGAETAVNDLPPAAQQLLLFILYIDVGLALGNLSGGQLSFDLLSLPADSPLSYDRIWESARLCLPKLWGAQYPHEEILDDVENYRGLSFLHAAQKLKLSIWRLGIAQEHGRDIKEIRARLWLRIEEMRKEFGDLLTLADIAPGKVQRRVMWTVYHGCLDFYATRILFSCLNEDDDRPDWLDETLKSLLAIAYKSLGENPHQLFRVSWPLAVALLKVQDSIHRDWIRSQLAKARILLSNLGLPIQALDRPRSPGSLFLGYSSSPVEEIE